MTPYIDGYMLNDILMISYLNASETLRIARLDFSDFFQSVGILISRIYGKVAKYENVIYLLKKAINKC